MPKRSKQQPVVVKHVSFRSSVELKPYQHAHIEASADVLPSQNPSDVLDELKRFVATELRITKEGKPVQTSGQFRI